MYLAWVRYPNTTNWISRYFYYQQQAVDLCLLVLAGGGDAAAPVECDSYHIVPLP